MPSEARVENFWWLVRVTLVVNLVFLPQTFGPVVGTYEGFLLLCECRWDGDFTCRWWGHLKTTCHNQACFAHVILSCGLGNPGFKINKKPRGFMQSCFPVSVYFKCLSKFFFIFINVQLLWLLHSIGPLP